MTRRVAGRPTGRPYIFFAFFAVKNPLLLGCGYAALGSFDFAQDRPLRLIPFFLPQHRAAATARAAQAGVVALSLLSMTFANL